MTLRPSGTQSEIPATFPLTVFTPDHGVPEWIQDDWQVLRHLAAESNTPGGLTRSPAAIAKQRRLNRTMDLVDPYRNHISNQLTLTHRDPNGHSATLQVPVEIHGNPPVIAFNARYLADALEIGGTLCLCDELSPGICRHPTGRFCVIMPMRVAIPAASDTRKPQSTADAA